MPPSAVSGTTSFVYNRNQIIKRALVRVGAIDAEETPGASLVNGAADCLNLMTKEWQAFGIHVWTEAEAILFLQPNQYQYSLGGTTSDKCALMSGWVQAFAGATMAAGATVIPMSSIAGIAAGDNIGLTLDSGPFFWTTISGAPSGGNVTLAAPLPGQVSAGNNVIDFAPAQQIVRPLRIPAGRRYAFAPQGGQFIEVPMLILSRQDYMDLPNKSQTGTVTQLFYSPQIGTGQQGPGSFYVWPAPPDATSAVRFTWYRPIDDWTNAATLGDFPTEWNNCLIWNLALELVPEYGVITAMQVQNIEKRAASSLQTMQGWDREPESIQFGVDMQRM
jgi:hypothetical protein